MMKKLLEDSELPELNVAGKARVHSSDLRTWA